MGQLPNYPNSGRSWRGRRVRAPSAPPPVRGGDGPPPGNREPEGGGWSWNWGSLIAGIILGIFIAWRLLIDPVIQDQEAAEAAREAAIIERDEAIRGTNDAIARANQETILRATAEAEQSEAEQVTQLETRLRATAESEARLAEEAQSRAESEARIQERLRNSAKSELEGQQVQYERRLALQLARTNTTIKAIATGELKFYIEPLPRYAADGVDEAIEDIARNLEGLSPEGATVSQTDDEDGADIYVQWVRDYGSHVLGRAIYQTIIHVGLGTTDCVGDWKAFDANTVRTILWHEFGHAFGHGHSEDPGNIMYLTTPTKFTLEHDISQQSLSSNRYEAFLICTTGEYNLSFQVDDESDDKFTFAVASPYSFFADSLISSSLGDNHDCGRRERRVLNVTCQIEAYSRVFIYNHNPNPVGFLSFLGNYISFSGKVALLDDPPWPDMTWDEDAFSYDEETLDYYRELFAEE